MFWPLLMPTSQHNAEESEQSTNKWFAALFWKENIFVITCIEYWHSSRPYEPAFLCQEDYMLIKHMKIPE